MSYGYAITNVLTPLATGAFSYSDEADGAVAVATGSNAYLNDGRLDRQVGLASLAAHAELRIDLDFGTPTALAGLAILNHNFCKQVTSGQVTVLCDNVAGSWGTTAKAITTLYGTDPKAKDHVLQFPSLTKRYWRLKFSIPSPTWTTPLFGEIFGFASATSLTRGSIYGSGENEEQLNAEVDSYNGNRRAYALGGPIRSKVLTFADLTQSQLAELQTMWRATKGSATPFLWMEDVESTSTAATDAAQECIFGRFELPDFNWVQDDFGIYQPPKVLVRSLGREIGS